MGTIDQSVLMDKMNTFLTNLAEKESLPKKALDGLCNGFAFMRARASLIGEEGTKQFFDRLEKLGGASDDEIKQWSSIYSAYPSYRREAKKEAKLPENDIIEKFCKEKSITKDDFHFIKDLYIFINSLVSSFDANRDLGINEAPQYAWLWLLSNLLPPDEMKSIVETTSFGFVFQNQELIDTLNKAIFEGDLVRIASSDHIMFITKKNGLYELYDPNQTVRSDVKELQFNSSDDLVKEIKKCFFDILKRDATWMPIGIKIIEKSDHIITNRPTGSELLDSLLISREINYQKMAQNNGEESKTYKDKKSLANALGLNSLSWDSYTSLNMAAKHGDAYIAKWLLDNGADPNTANKQGITPLFFASQFGYENIVSALLSKQEVNPTLATAEGYKPLYIAALHGQLNTVKILLEKVDPNDASKGGLTPLHAAAIRGHASVIKMLLENKAEPDLKTSMGSTPLSLAARDGHLAAVEELVERKVDINSVNNKGCSPLYLAAENGHFKVVERLLEKEAKPDLASKEGITPLIIAAYNGRSEVVKVLLNNKNVNLDAMDDYQWTPLHSAAGKGYANIVKMLLDTKKVSLDLKNEDGDTPLSLAIKNGNSEIASLLLKNGADPFVKLKDKDQTLLSLAVEKKQWEIVCHILMSDKCKSLSDSELNALNTPSIKAELSKTFMKYASATVNKTGELFRFASIGDNAFKTLMKMPDPGAYGFLSNTFGSSCLGEINEHVKTINRELYLDKRVSQQRVKSPTHEERIKTLETYHASNDEKIQEKKESNIPDEIYNKRPGAKAG